MHCILTRTIDVTQASTGFLIRGVVIGLAVASFGSGAIAQQAQPAAPAIATIENPLLPQSDEEAKILSVLDDLDRNDRQGMMNVPLDDGRLLRLLTESIGAKRVVEIGTSNGYSGIWFCLALRKTGGQLITHELDAKRAELARGNFKRAGVAELVTLVEGDAHETVKQLKEPIDILFIDADKPGYPDYLTKLLPLVRPGGLIIGHNMHRPAPSPEYIKAITTDPALETVFLNMHAAGIAITVKKR
jgi:predicted O-methyltransferase YrrM